MSIAIGDLIDMLLAVFFFSFRDMYCVYFILWNTPLLLQFYSNFSQTKCSYMWIRVAHQNIHANFSILDILSNGQPDIQLLLDQMTCLYVLIFLLFFSPKWLPARARAYPIQHCIHWGMWKRLVSNHLCAVLLTQMRALDFLAFRFSQEYNIKWMLTASANWCF
jgi:accessory gene regulator protein AgrB